MLRVKKIGMLEKCTHSVICKYICNSYCMYKVAADGLVYKMYIPQYEKKNNVHMYQRIAQANLNSFFFFDNKVYRKKNDCICVFHTYKNAIFILPRYQF